MSEMQDMTAQQPPIALEAAQETGQASRKAARRAYAGHKNPDKSGFGCRALTTHFAPVHGCAMNPNEVSGSWWTWGESNPRLGNANAA